MNNFNVTIPAGSKIALVGHSGCGKSTLINILLRFYNINDGTVLVDGEDLDKYNVLAVREQCGYVMQEPVLFNTDIKTNIRFGKPEATDEEVYIAAQKANAIGFITETLENLTPQQRQEKLEASFNQAFEMIQGTAPEIASWRDDYVGKDAFGKQLLIDLLTNITKTGLIQKA